MYKGPEFQPAPVVVKPPNAPGFPLPIEPGAKPGLVENTPPNFSNNGNRNSYGVHNITSIPVALGAANVGLTIDTSGQAFTIQTRNINSAEYCAPLELMIYVNDSVDGIYFTNLDYSVGDISLPVFFTAWSNGVDTYNGTITPEDVANISSPQYRHRSLHVAMQFYRLRIQALSAVRNGPLQLIVWNNPVDIHWG